MDEFSGLDRPRPLNEELRESLEAVFAEHAPAHVVLSGIDRPRPLPAETREKILRLMTARPSLRLVRIHPLSTALASAVAVAAVVIGIFVLGAERGAPLRPGGPKPSQDLIAIASPPPTEATSEPVQSTPTVPSSSSATGGRGSVSTNPARAPRHGEVCFPEESCPVSAAMAPHSPGPSPSPTAQVPPDPPRNVAASTGPGIGEISVRWEPPSSVGSSPLRKYALYRKDSDGVEVTVAILEADVTSYLDRDLPVGSYSYRLRVRNYDAISAYSQASEATSLNTPS